MARFAHRHCPVWLTALSIGASLASPALAQDEHVSAITNGAIAGAHARLQGAPPPAEGAAPTGEMKLGWIFATRRDSSAIYFGIGEAF